MAHFGTKTPVRTHRMHNTARLRSSLLYPNCTYVCHSAHKVNLLLKELI